MRLSFILLLIIICLFPIVSADLFPTPSETVNVGFGDGTWQTGVNIIIPEEIFNSSEATSNSTDYWNTNIGTLGTINATQFNNNGGTLNIIETWVNSKWCELVGCTMTGDLTLPNLIATGIITATGGISTDWNTAYTHSQDNSQAHSDYLLNTGDTGTGDYILDGAVTINEAGADKNFRVEGVGKPNALFVQGSDGRIGIGTNSPSNALDIIKSGFGTTLLIKDTYASTDIKNGAVNGLFYISSVAGITVTAVRGRGTLANPLAIGVNDNIYAFDFYAQILDGIGNFSKVSSFGASMDGATNKGFLFFNAGAAGSATVRMKITGDDIEIVGDNFPLTFGAGQEANIYYDGTDLIIDPKAVGSGKVKIEGALNVTGITHVNDKISFTQTDGNEYIDSPADGVLDIAATTSLRILSPSISLTQQKTTLSLIDNNNSAMAVYQGLSPYQIFDTTNSAERIRLFKKTQIGDGGVTNYLTIEKNGDTFWTGAGTGIPFSNIYGNEIAWVQASAVQNTWYPIVDADMTSGELNLITHDGNGKITFAKAGRYRIDLDFALEANSANVHIQIGARVNAVVQNALNHVESKFSNTQEAVSLSTIVSVSANDTLEAVLRTTDTGTPDITVDHLVITATMVGG